MGKFKSSRKKTVSLIAATAMSLFSLLAVFAATMAWFAMNKDVGGNGMNVQVAKASNIKLLSCYAVRYDGNYGAIAIDVTNGNEAITMSEYDYIFTDRNVNTPLFLRMEVTNFNTEQDLTVTIPCTGTYKTDNKVDPYLSNVVSAKFMRGLKSGNTVSKDEYVWSGSSVHNDDVAASYQGMVNNATTITGTPFVENNTKRDSIMLTLDADDIFNSDFIVTRDDGQGNDIDVVVVYVALDYHVNGNVNLVTSYLDSYNGAQHSLSFDGDIQTITLGNEGE